MKKDDNKDSKAGDIKINVFIMWRIFLFVEQCDQFFYQEKELIDCLRIDSYYYA